MRTYSNIRKNWIDLFCLWLLTLIVKFIAKGRCHELQNECPSNLVSFYLYKMKSRGSLYKEVQLFLNDTDSINKVEITVRPVKFIIHGFGSSRFDEGLKLMKEKYRYQNIENIFMLEYGDSKKSLLSFIKIIKKLAQIAYCAAKLIHLLINKRLLIIENFHIIGFSLGAHIAAQIAKSLCTGEDCIRLPRITGLDPGNFIDSKKMLHKGHADFVDVIHTNAGFLGVSYSNAHVDAYANNGYKQLGCTFFDFTCSHIDAIRIYNDSILSPYRFRGRKCDKSLISIFSGKCNIPENKGNEEITIGEYSTKPFTKNEGKYVFETE